LFCCAQTHADEDRKGRETVEKRNKLDSMIFEVEKTVNENQAKLPADEVTKVKEALEKAKETLKNSPENGEELEKAHNELMQASHKMAEIIYSQKDNQNGEAKNSDQTDANAGETVDAEINE